MRRVPEVIDAWYDSGAISFAQFGYPHVPGSAERFAELFPADLVCEAIDQTRGWFYSLEAVSTLLFDRNSYRRGRAWGSSWTPRDARCRRPRATSSTHGR
jgi:isoleucyl-tRNA synthetase